MPDFDATNAECTILTFKEGLLSPVAHDLAMTVTRFVIEVDPAGETPSVRATFDARSLRTRSAMKEGRENPGALSASDLRTIDGNIVRSVLHADRWPEIRFTSGQVLRQGDRFEIAGTLELHGHEAEVEVTARPQGERLVAELTLDQTRFGIRPYTGLMGTLRIKPDVRVRVSVPAAGLL